jgi:hypothetical protein
MAGTPTLPAGVLLGVTPRNRTLPLAISSEAVVRGRIQPLRSASLR